MTTRVLNRFSVDRNGRVPFALIAITILMATTVLAAMVAMLQNEIDVETDLLEEEREIRSLEARIRDLARTIAEDELRSVIKEGGDLGEVSVSMKKELFRRSNRTFDRADGWVVEIHDVDLGIDLGYDVTGRVMGDANWSAVSPKGHRFRRQTDLSSPLDWPFGLAIQAWSRFEASGAGGGDLSKVIRYMLFKLATVRAANGELDGTRLLTKKDIGLALELALDMYLVSSSGKEEASRPMMDLTGDNHGWAVEGPADPADRFLERLNLTSVRSSSIMAQYLVGLIDYYLLWFRDYSGIGEGVEAFFEWAGIGLGGDPEDHRAWWRNFKVGDVIERWAYQVLSTLLHVILEMTQDEEIDVRDLEFGELAERVTTVVNRTVAEVSENQDDPDDKEGLDLDLAEALDHLPTAKGNGTWVLDALKGSLMSAALEAMDLLLTGAKDMVARAWHDTEKVDRLYGISMDRSPSLIPSLEGGDQESSVPEATGVVLDLKGVDHRTSVVVKGVHHTAPEKRWGRMFDQDDGGGVLDQIRPYETDYGIEITGRYWVKRFLVHSKDPISDLGTVSGLSVNWSAPINISFVVPVFTGVPLENVDYDPSDTLLGDMVEIVWEFVNWTWEGMQWVAGSINRLFSGLVDGITELGRRGIENLGDMSAAKFSRTVEGVLKALNNKAWNDALNLTWRFLRDLVGEDVRDLLTFQVDIFGLELTVEIDLFKESLIISHTGPGYGFSLVFKLLVEDVPPFTPRPVDGFRYCLLGTAYLESDGLSIEASLDPLTIVYPSVIHVFGESRDEKGKGFRLELDAPVVQRRFKEWEVSVSSVTGVPIQGIPIPGTSLSVDLDIGLRVKYGKGILSPEKLLVKAVRGAWYETLKGYTVRELFGELGDPDLVEAFIIQLLNNIVNEIGDRVSKEIPEIELFIEGGVSAGNGVISGGFGLSFVIMDPVHVLLELLPWFIDNLRAFLLGMGTPGMPTGFVALPSKVSENLFVRGTIRTHVGAPEILGGEGTGRLELKALLEANLPAMGALIGADLGRWMFRAGMVLPDLPSVLVSLLPGFRAPKPSCDLWLVEVKVTELDNDRAKISEVYYDTTGRDNEEEFVEIWNPTNRRIDLSRWIIKDNGGNWRLPDHLSLPAGRRILVARDKEGIRSVFGRLPEVHGFPLNLNNDGDSLVLLDPFGVEIDEVAWEGGVPGWRKGCEEGQSLRRGPVDTNGPSDWFCGRPDPWH